MAAFGAVALLLDASYHGSDDYGSGNAAAALLSLNVAPDMATVERGLDRVADLVWESLPAERARRLIDDLMDWVSVCQPGIAPSLLESKRRELKREEETTVMALARMGIEYPRRLRAEARAEGRVEGRAEGQAQGRAEIQAEWLTHDRNLLLRQVTRKFGAETAERLEPLLATVQDTARLADVGDWIIDCDAADDLLARVSGTGNGR